MSKESSEKPNQNNQKPNRKSGPSLFDDALSDRVTKKKISRFLWPAVFIVLGLAMTYSIFYGASEQKEELIAELEEKAEEDASALEQKLADLRNRQNGGEEAESASVVQTDETAPPGVQQPEKPIKRPNDSEAGTETKTVSIPQDEPTRQLQDTTPSEPTTSSSRSTDKPSERPPLRRNEESTESSVMSEESSESEQETVIEPTPEPEPVNPPAHELAYNLLLETSTAAGKLANGEYSTLDYADNWRVVQENKSEVWIDLIAHWTGGGDSVHFIWAVNPETKKIRALSQAARNLEAEQTQP